MKIKLNRALYIDMKRYPKGAVVEVRKERIENIDKKDYSLYVPKKDKE